MKHNTTFIDINLQNEGFEIATGQWPKIKQSGLRKDIVGLKILPIEDPNDPYLDFEIENFYSSLADGCKILRQPIKRDTPELNHWILSRPAFWENSRYCDWKIVHLEIFATYLLMQAMLTLHCMFSGYFLRTNLIMTFIVGIPSGILTEDFSTTAFVVISSIIVTMAMSAVEVHTADKSAYGEHNEKYDKVFNTLSRLSL